MIGLYAKCSKVLYTSPKVITIKPKYWHIKAMRVSLLEQSKQFALVRQNVDIIFKHIIITKIIDRQNLVQQLKTTSW